MVTTDRYWDPEAYISTIWMVAILSYGFGDIVTTLVGLKMHLATEASPLAAFLMQRQGIGFIYVAKLSTLGLFYLLWRVAPRSYRSGVPIGLCLVGVGVTMWNLTILISSI